MLEAETLVSRQYFDLVEIATLDFVKKVHRRMFGKTWRWAGQFRTSNKNIGVDWVGIPVELRVLVDDLRYQLKNKSYPLDELAVRFHHRLVAVHPFVNGNGRHARLMTDILLLSQGEKRFSWGMAEDLIVKSPVRKKYISALRAADKLDYAPLLTFVKER
ncbi:mobile mystery protein B [Coxiella burnetii]|uniref:mobile mystery protein B n=1 Tax=Coxiella burnetii TaxID=777 RepID=UPI0032215727